MIPSAPRIFLVGSPEDVKSFWLPGSELRVIIEVYQFEKVLQIKPPVVLASAASSDQNPQRQALIDQLLERDPRNEPCNPLQLLERQLNVCLQRWFLILGLIFTISLGTVSSA